MLKQITALIITFGLGATAMYIYLMPKIAEWRAEELIMNAFSECVEDKIIGQNSYQELYLLDVLSCAEGIIIQE